MTIPDPAPDHCTEVGLLCPVEGTIYGYYPSISANGFFTGFFGLCLIIQLVLGIRYKTWTYLIALGLGCLGECLGYVGRIMLYNNPFDSAGFQIQICCLIISPAFVSAGIYLTLKHAVISFGESWSRFRPAMYTYIFIAGDLVSLVLQGVGGGIAATTDPGELQDIGITISFTDCRCRFPGSYLVDFWLSLHGVCSSHLPLPWPGETRSQRIAL